MRYEINPPTLAADCASVQAFSVVQGDERIRTAALDQRTDVAGSIRGLTERGKLPQTTVAVVAVDARPNDRCSAGMTRDLSLVPSQAAPRSVSPAVPGGSIRAVGA